MVKLPTQTFQIYNKQRYLEYAKNQHAHCTNTEYSYNRGVAQGKHLHLTSLAFLL